MLVIPSTLQKLFIDRAFAIFDRQKNGRIVVDEYIETLAQLAGKNADTAIEFLFRIYDINGDGSLHMGELKEVLKASIADSGMTFDEQVNESLKPQTIPFVSQILHLRSDMFERSFVVLALPQYHIKQNVVPQERLVSARHLERLAHTHAPAHVVLDPDRLVEVPLPNAVRIDRVLEHHVQLAAVHDGDMGPVLSIEILDICPQDLNCLDRHPTDDYLQPGKSGAGFRWPILARV